MSVARTAASASPERRRRTAQRKVRAGFFLALASLVAVAVASYASVQRLRISGQWVEHTYQVLGRLDRLLLLTVEAETAERGYVVTGDEDYLANYRTAADAITPVEQELHDLVADNPGQQQRLQQLTQLVADRLAALDAVDEVRRTQGLAAAQELIRQGPGKGIHNRFRQQIEQIGQAERYLLLERQRRVERDIGITTLVGIGGSLLALLCVAWAALASRRDMVRVEIARDEADRANQTKGRFLAAASHDLRQPLQTLSMLNGTLRRIVTDADSANAIAQQQQAIDSMSGLLNTLLDISKLESGTLEPEIVRFDLQQLFAELRVEFSEPAARKGLQLEVVACPESVVSDPTLLGQILRNLLSNAIRYTHNGCVRMQCQRDGQRLRIDVSDTGIGIPPEHLQDIFEEFFQVDAPTGSGREGHGLGLSIVHRVARLLDHELQVRSRIGEGSVFSVFLPVGPATGAQLLATAAMPQRPA